MSDLTYPPIPGTRRDFAYTSLLSLLRRQDQGLFLQAAGRWRDSRQSLHELVVQAPGVRDSIDQLLKAHLQLAAQPVGLGFLKTGQTDEHFVSLTDAWAFICQFPDISPSLDTRCVTVGLATHRLAGLTPVQLLEHLKALNLQQLLKDRWNSYWNARAPGTPLSRRARAAQLYCQHFEACAQLAYAQGQLSALQLTSLQAVLNPVTILNGALPIESWQLALVLPDQSKVKLPGAWVIAVGEQPMLTQTLYLPCRQPGLRVFSQRSEMQEWLTAPAQQLVPPDIAPNSITVDYSPRTEPLEHGILDLLSHLHTAQLESLRNRHRSGSELADYARHALDDADRLDRQRREIPVLTAPPELEHDPSSEADGVVAPLHFGHLHADIALSERWAAVKQQRLALESFLGDEPPPADRLQQLQTLMQTLSSAGQASNTAAVALLGKRTALEYLELRQQPNADYDALYQARRSALRAEGAIQHALEQISADEHRMLQAVLDHPDAPHLRPDVVAARLSLVSSDPNEGTNALTGLLLITQASALTSPAAHSLLLYWPGNAGGLQRFESRQALEQSLLKLPAEDRSATLQLSILTGDPIEYSLQQQLYASEQKASALIALHPVPGFSQARAEAFDTLREQTLFDLQTPVHQARELAYAQLLEQQRSAALASALPPQLSQLPADERSALKTLTQAHITALHRTQQLLERELEPFDDFAQRRLNLRLAQDFMLAQHCSVHLDLPDSVSQEREYLSEYAGPGTPFKYITVPSPQRSSLTLLQLAQQNIDPKLAQRLTYMRVNISSPDPTEAARLTQGLTLEYLKTLVQELDLPGVYENLITRTFLGDPAAPPFTTQHRRECLTEPLRLMLILQGKRARALGQFDDNDLRLLNIAIDASSAADWQVAGKRIVLLPAQLSTGGEDTDYGPTTLAGVTFIQEQVSGLTLLYLPNSPDSQDLRRYPNLELARKALYDLSLASGMSAYLAGLAIKGDTAAHLARITQAQQKNFDAIFAVGTPWPVTTSLARHLLNTHMGRVIEAHRATSRSNAALLLEQNALRAGLIFNYLKIALGLVPFVGSVVALYDAWNSANLAAAAFLRGNVGHGLADVEAVLLSLIDCAMDVLPGSLALPTSARAITRQRQLRNLGSGAASLHLSSISQAQRAMQRFAGYEYEGVISLAGIQPQAHGFYRNVYRHADGDFIVRRGRIYQVELGGDPLDWRLSPTRSKTYKQPIALDENGEWDTHFGVYGTAFNGGLAGGGGVLGHMADTLDPLWPQATRAWLPRWLTDRVYRHQQAMASSIQQNFAVFQKNHDRVKNLLDRYESGDTSTLKSLDDALTEGVELAKKVHHDTRDLSALSHGNRATAGSKAQSELAYDVAWYSQVQVKIRSEQLFAIEDAIDALEIRLQATPFEQLSARAALREQIRAQRIANLQRQRTLDTSIETLNTWQARVTHRELRQGLTTASEVINRHLSARRRAVMKVEALLDLVDHRKGVGDSAWHYLQGPLTNAKNMVSHALYLQLNVVEVGATQLQRNTILNFCISAYAQMRSHLRRWTVTYPQHFDADYSVELLEELQTISDRARKSLSERPSPRPAGSTRRVFETQDNTLLIGVEHWDPATNTRTYSLTGAGGRTEVWQQGADGRCHLTNPEPIAPPVPAAISGSARIAEARLRLNRVQAYVASVQRYAQHNMLPVDLQEMLVREADELLDRARAIEPLAPNDPVIEQLRTQAAGLSTQGRTLRTRYSLTSVKPTDGMLDDLVTEHVVEVRRTNPIKELAKRKDGRRDFMQEYEIWDLTATPPQPLWYAHFHYNRRTAAFGEFEKAHLKLPQHRFLTHADEPDLPYSDIGRHSTALPHIEPLWLAAE